jgi:BirA family biotin operon repressor/biotin-[acetyl-CoA-carboxylase] ligase
MKWDIHQFETLESTNMTARSCPPGTVVMAETQTAGRGRYGRTWQSPKGNLYMSLVLPDMGKNTPYIAFLTAVAVADSLPDFNVSLKWPNDVLLDGKKLAGILVEKVGDKVIVGIGVNIISNPTENVLYPTASLEGRLRPMTVAKRILLQYNTLLELLDKKGFKAIRARWLSCAKGLGQAMSVHLADSEVQGIFKGISATGALLLKEKRSTRKITVGDVFLI